MHELSIIASIIDLVKAEVEKMGNVILVKEVHLQVGDLTFLGHEQLMFGFEHLAGSEPLIDSGGLRITPVPARIKCLNCGYEGGLNLAEPEHHQMPLPIFACPECEGRIEVLEGKGCVVTNLVLETEDE